MDEKKTFKSKRKQEIDDDYIKGILKNVENEKKKIMKDNLNKLLKELKETLDKYKPKDIVKYLDQYVIGQEQAKKVLSVAIYNHYKRILSNNGFIINNNNNYDDVEIEKGNIFIQGPTGSGKTFIIKKLAQLLNVPYFISDATGMTAAGYVGNDVESMLTGLLCAANHDVQKTQLGICVIDEIDKIARKGENVSITRDVSGEDCQQGMLKIIESTTVGVMPNGGRLNPTMNLTYIDTTNILFIGLGAFEGMERIIEKRTSKTTIGYKSNNEKQEKNDDYDILDYATPADFRSFGMIPELIGRFPIITHTSYLKKKDLIKIITEPKNSILKQYQKLLDLDNVSLSFSDDALDEIAEIAIQTKTGARGLRNVLEKILIDVMYEASDICGQKIIVTRDMVKKCKIEKVA